MIQRKLIIFSPFKENGSWQAGSLLRFHGYTNGLENTIPNIIHYGYGMSNAVHASQFVSCTIHRRWRKIMFIHNVLFFGTLRFFSFLLRIIIENYSHVKELDQLGRNVLFYSHQDSSLATYLHITRNVPYVYDIHGIFAVQKEYTINYNWWKKFWFRIYLKHERIVFENAPFLNVVSREMAVYIQSNYNVSGRILLAPDGIPDTIENYQLTPMVNLDVYRGNGKKIILFAGSCKPMGGAKQLLETYLQSKALQDEALLLLITTDNRYLEGVDRNENVKIIPPMLHTELIGYMKAADVIVCPDNEDNVYNQICPHIKFYDALATGTPIVVTDLSVNRNIMKNMNYPVFYFSKKGVSLENSLLKAIKVEHCSIDIEMLSNLTYAYQMKEYWKMNLELLLKS